MAKKKTEKAKERTYIIPLRKEFIKAPRNKKAKKAVKAIKEFLKKHMKVETVKLGPRINEEVWKNGIENPPSKIKVDVLIDKDVARAELSGFKIEIPKEKEKKEEDKDGSSLKEKLGAMVKDKEEKKEEKIEEEKDSDLKEKEEELKEQRGTKKGKTEQEKVLTKKGSAY